MFATNRRYLNSERWQTSVKVLIVSAPLTGECTSCSFPSPGWVIQGWIRRPSRQLVISLRAHRPCPGLVHRRWPETRVPLSSLTPPEQTSHRENQPSSSKGQSAPEATSNYTCLPSRPSLTHRGLKHELWRAMMCHPRPPARGFWTGAKPLLAH